MPSIFVQYLGSISGVGISTVSDSTEVKARVFDRRIPGSSPADRSMWAFFARFPQNDLAAGLDPGILR